MFTSKQITALALLGAVWLASCGTVGNGSYGTTIGNGQSCQVESLTTGILGNASSVPYVDGYTNPATTSLVNFDGTNGAAGGPGSGWTTIIMPSDPCLSSQVGIVYASAATSGSPYYPRMTLINLATGATQTATLATDDAQNGCTSATPCSNQGHDDPGFGCDLPGIKACVFYGAQSTTAGAPSAWQNSTLLGSTYGMYPFKLGNCLGGGAGCWDAAGSQYFAPGPGFSEPSLASGPTVNGAVQLLCGQTQPNTNVSLSGSPGCFTMRIKPSLSDVCFDVVYGGTNYTCMLDTTAQTGAAWATACPGSTSCNGFMALMKNPASNNYYYFTVTAADGGTNAGTLTVNCPTTGTASVSIATTDTTTSGVASKIATAMQTSCDTTNYTYGTGGTGGQPTCTASCVWVQFTSSKTYSALTAPQANNVTASAGTTGVAANANVASYTTSGSRHFVWEGPMYFPQLAPYPYVDMGDVQFETQPLGSVASTSYSNNGAQMLYVMRSAGPDALGNWTWYDYGLHNGSITKPGNGTTAPQLLGAGAGGSCSVGVYCSEPDTGTIGANNFCVSLCTISQGQSPYILPPPTGGYLTGVLPWCYDHSVAGQDSCTSNNTTVPIVSQEVAWFNQGKLWIAYPEYRSGGETSIVVMTVAPGQPPVVTNQAILTTEGATKAQVVLTLVPITTPTGVTLYAYSGYGARMLTWTSGTGTYGQKFVYTNSTSTWSAAQAANGTTALGGANGNATPCSGNSDPMHYAALFFCYQAGSTTFPSNPVNFYYFNQ